MRIASVLALLAALLAIGGLPPVHAAPDGAAAGGGAGPDDIAWARDVVAERLPKAKPVADLPQDPSLWLNVASPLSFERELKGKVVVLDFWCTCCINCMHVLPDLAWLEHKWAGQPVAFVGVHSPKFARERERSALREAVRRYEIEHPVLSDPRHEVWGAFGARAWPTFAVVAPDGRVVGSLSGEGHRASLDALITVLLERARADGVPTNARELPIRLERASRPPSSLAYPGKLAVHPDGQRLYVADTGHHRVLELTTDGRFLRSFGDGTAGLVDGGSAEVGPPRARFDSPQGLVVWREALWVADTGNHALRHIDLESGLVTTVAGTGAQGWERAGVHPAATHSLASPWDVLPYDGGLLVAMAGTHQLWRYDVGARTIALWAGDGSERRLDAEQRFAAAFAQPSALVTDGSSLYVADSESSSVVVVRPEGTVLTLAGASTNPRDLFHFGDEDGTGHGRRFQHPLGLAWIGDRLWVADTYNHKLKTVQADGTVTSVLGDGQAGLSDHPVRFDEPSGLAAQGNVLWVADTNAHAIRRVDTTTGEVRTLRLVGVPIPSTHVTEAAGAVPAEELFAPSADDIRPAVDAQRLAAGVPVQLVVEQPLPAGWKHSPGTTPRVRVVVGGRAPVYAELVGGRAELTLPALAEGPTTVDVRLKAWLCQDEGTCQARSVHWQADLSVTGDGEPALWFLDAFEPVGPADALVPDR
ncbi:MAG: thioredoxin-like domain-containing protein [Planctomycetota bacterium]